MRQRRTARDTRTRSRNSRQGPAPQPANKVLAAAYTYGSPEGASRNPLDRLCVFLTALIGIFAFWSTAAVEISAALFLAAFIVRVSFTRDVPVLRMPIPRPALAGLWLWFLYLICILVSLFVFHPLSSAAGSHVIWHPLLFPAVYALDLRARDIRIIGIAFLASACAAAVVTLPGFLSTTTGRLESVLVGDTTFVDLMVLAAIIAIAAAVAGQGRTRALALCGIPVVAAVILSAMRGPVAILAAASFIMLAAVRPRSLALWIAAAAIIVIFCPPVLRMKLDWLMAGNPIDRYPVWRTGLGLIATAPAFGFGPGSFQALLPPAVYATFIHRPPLSWHNDLLQICLDLGWLTAAAYAAFLLSVFLPVFRRLVRWRTSEPGALMALVTMLLVSLLLMSSVGLVVMTSVLGAVLWILSALTLSTFSKDALNGR